MAGVVMLLIGFVQDESALGDRALREGRYAEAAEHYERAAARGGASAGLWRRLGLAYSRLEQWAKAAAAYRSCLALEGESGADLWRAFAQASSRAGALEDALEAWAKAESLDPGGRDALFRARALVERERWTLAEHETARFLRVHPRDPEARELWAYVLERTARKAEAAEVYRELLREDPFDANRRLRLAGALAAQERADEAIDVLEAGRRLASSGPAAERLLADLYLERRMYREAAACYARLVAGGKERAAEDFHRLGHAYYQTGEFLSAKEAFERARAIDPAHAGAALFLGHAAAARGEVEEARRAYEAAARANPRDARPCRALGDLELRQGRPAEAAAAYAQAVARGGGDAAVHANRVACLLQAGLREEALSALKDAVKAHPTDERWRAFFRELARGGS